MERRDACEHYQDYLIISKRLVTATGLSELLDNNMVHDYISDALNQKGLNKKSFWQEVKPFVRKVEKEDSCFIIDDFILNKPHSTTNEIINYHFDHTVGRTVKGINVLNFLLNSKDGDEKINCPIGFHIVHKTIPFKDPKTGKQKFKSEVTKNEVVLEQLRWAVFFNKIKFKYILFDVWFAASDTLKFIHEEIKKEFVCPIKKNRQVALSRDEKLQGEFKDVSEIEFETNECKQVYLRGLDFPVKLVKQIFTNKDGSEGVQYLITNDMDMNYEEITTIYKRRWKVEEFHKSLKQNLMIEKSPTKNETSQSNHIFFSMLAFIKLEKLKITEKLNHFALSAKLYLKMLRVAHQELMGMLEQVS